MCCNCGWGQSYALGRCQACYRYLLRHAIERPKKLFGRERRVMCACRRSPVEGFLRVTIRTPDREQQALIGVCGECFELEQEMIDEYGRLVASG